MNGFIAYKFTRKFCAAAICALYFAAPAFAEGESCAAGYSATDLSPNGVRSYLKEYAASGDDPLKVTSLLHGALRPMMNRLSKGAAALSDADLEAMIKKSASMQPARQSKNDDFFFDRIFQQGSYQERAMNHARSTAEHRYSSPENFGSVPELLWLPKDAEFDEGLGHASSALKSLATPIGEYGKDFALDTQRTAAVMVKLVEQHTPEVGAEIYEKNGKLLYAHTARAKAVDVEETRRGLAPSAAMIEGVVSLHQLVGALLAQKIPGVETGDQALRLLMKDHGQRMGLTSRVASRLSMGTIGPVAQSGRYFNHGLVLENGKLQTTKELEQWLANKRGGRKSVCPFAGLFGPKDSRPHEDLSKLQTPIQELSEMYLRIYEQVKKMPRAEPVVDNSVPK